MAGGEWPAWLSPLLPRHHGGAGSIVFSVAGSARCTDDRQSAGPGQSTRGRAVECVAGGHPLPLSVRRGAVLTCGAVVGVLVAIDLGARVAGTITTATSEPGLMGYGRLTLSVLAAILNWLSPFAYLSRLVDPYVLSGVEPYTAAAGA